MQYCSAKEKRRESILKLCKLVKQRQIILVMPKIGIGPAVFVLFARPRPPNYSKTQTDH